MIIEKLRFGLASKFSLSLSVVILATLLPLGHIFTARSLHQIETAMVERGKSITNGLSNGGEYGLLVENRQILDGVIKKYAGEKDLLYILIRNASGEILASYEKNSGDTPDYVATDGPSENDRQLGFDCRLAETDLQYDFTRDVVTTQGRRSREDIGLLQSDEVSERESDRVKKIGTAQIGLSKAGMKAFGSRLILDSAYLVVGAVGAMILATVTLVRIMVRPIGRLAIAAGEVAHGDFDHLVEVKSKDEIGELAEAFNRMMIDLKISREALQHQLEAEERIAGKLARKTEELSRSNEALDAFMYTVSHDLKAPVVSLQGFSSLLMKGYEDRLDESGKMYVDRIQKNSERMGTLIDHLLELSRIGRMEKQQEMVDISTVVSDVADELAAQLCEKGTRLVVKDEMPTLLCDRIRTSQIFANLISNASKFMGEDNEDPTIEVGHDDQGDCYTFYVKDNGIGINEEYHEKIFQIFQRLGDVETEGTGVGLAIVKKIVESLGGRTWVDSAEGKGTTMRFTIPKSDQEVQNETDRHIAG